MESPGDARSAARSARRRAEPCSASGGPSTTKAETWTPAAQSHSTARVDASESPRRRWSHRAEPATSALPSAAQASGRAAAGRTFGSNRIPAPAAAATRASATPSATLTRAGSATRSPSARTRASAQSSAAAGYAGSRYSPRLPLESEKNTSVAATQASRNRHARAAPGSAPDAKTRPRPIHQTRGQASVQGMNCWGNLSR